MNHDIILIDYVSMIHSSSTIDGIKSKCRKIARNEINLKLKY